MLKRRLQLFLIAITVESIAMALLRWRTANLHSHEDLMMMVLGVIQAPGLLVANLILPGSSSEALGWSAVFIVQVLLLFLVGVLVRNALERRYQGGADT